MVSPRWFSTFALLATFFALNVIGLGALTRLLDAGLGCPDWPGCYGHFIVPFTHMVQMGTTSYSGSAPFIAYKAWAEMIHRYFAGTLSGLVFILITLSFLKPWRKLSNFVLSFILFILIIYQIILGQWTVTLKLWPIIVVQHLLGGFFILSTLWLLYLNNRPLPRRDVKLSSWDRRLLIGMVLVGVFFLGAQIFLGAWTSTNYAALSCPDFPFCTRAALFPFDFHAWGWELKANTYEGGVLSNGLKQSIQMMHRLGALIVTIDLLFMASIANLKLAPGCHLLKVVYVILALLCTQISLGIVNVLFKLPLWTAVLHNIVASLLLLGMITLLYQLITVRSRPIA